MEEIVYFNGAFMPASQARISIHDHGFLYGYGLFETMRAYHGKIFLLERHLKRLLDSVEIIGLESTLANVNLGEACRQTMRANGLVDARLRLTISNGETASFPWTGVGGTPTILVTAVSYMPFPQEKYSEGYRVGIASVRRCRTLISRIKSTNYLVSILAMMEAGAHGLDEALLLNDQGFIAEGGGCNVFLVMSSGLVTPSLESGILPGITREVVMELAEKMGIGVTEGDVSLFDLERCDEAFLTSSMIEVMPLVAVRDIDGEDITIGTGEPGSITRRLMAAYREMVERETV
jgi:branched-chain amino acid aminotransferase